MVVTTLAIAGASTLAVAIVYGYVGLRLARHARPANSTGRAMQFFSMWWLTTSANQMMGSALYLAAAFGATDLTVQYTYVYLQRLLLALSLVGLMYYLLYLQTGKSYLVPLAVVYAFYFATQLYGLSTRGALEVQHYGWRTDIVWANPEIPALRIVNLLLIVVPPVVGALLMLRIYRRVETPTRRFRIAMIGIGFVIWWSVAIVAGNPSTFDVAWFQALNRLIGISVAVGILLAYEPLPWMQRRYHLEPYHAQS